MRNATPDRDDRDDEEGSPVEETALVTCPYCGEAIEISLDVGGGPVQDYVEDCPVCCQPWQVHVRWRGGGEADVNVAAANE